MGGTEYNLKSAVAGETHEYTDMYPGMAKDARDEGSEELADWMETLAKAERSHANRFQKALDPLEDWSIPAFANFSAGADSNLPTLHSAALH